MGLVDGKAVVVTGAGRGIGEGHATVLAAEGASVVVNDVDAAEAGRVVGAITAAGGRAVASDDDVGTRKGCEALIERCAGEFGKIDGVVNNAGIVRDRSFLKMSDEEFDDVWRIHVKGTFWCTQLAALRMRDQGTGGSIVNTVSAALFGNFGQTNYGAAKGAIMSMTFTTAFELARFGIRVNAIGPIATTRMSATFVNPDETGERPFFDPALNAPLVVYLISDEGNYVTGQIYGTGAERVQIMTQPEYKTGMFREGGWDVEAVRKFFPQQLGKQLQPFGLMKKPYPFYDGVKVEKK